MTLTLTREGDAFTIDQTGLHIVDMPEIALTRDELEWLHARIGRMLTEPDVTRFSTTRPGR